MRAQDTYHIVLHRKAHFCVPIETIIQHRFRIFFRFKFEIHRFPWYILAGQGYRREIYPQLEDVTFLMRWWNRIE